VIRRRGAVILLPFCLLVPDPAAAQWAADLYAGGTRYDAVAALAAAANLVANLRYDSPRLSGYLSAAAPATGDAPVWSALGGSGRLARGLAGPLRAGLELDADGYVFRQSGGTSGGGITTRVIPTLGARIGRVAVQLRGGRHDHHVSAATRSSRHLWEAGARVTTGDAERFVIGDVRMLLRSNEHYPLARLQAGTTVGPAGLWGMAGRWLGSDLSETIWGAGASMDVGARGQIWTSVRHDAPDPLYLSAARTSWNVGVSLRLGARGGATPGPLVRGGTLVLRLPRALAAGGAPAVAGEFSDWVPLPMTLAGDEWRIEVPVRSGVYRFAFVRADGEWFVPAGYPGRMSDDMGGHVALVVVP
jgi:hypothetical protein